MLTATASPVFEFADTASFVRGIPPPCREALGCAVPPRILARGCRLTRGSAKNLPRCTVITLIEDLQVMSSEDKRPMTTDVVSEMLDCQSVELEATQEPERRLRTAVWAADHLTLTGLTETLMSRVEVFVTPSDNLAEVDVLLFAADRVTSKVLASMRRAAAKSDAPAIVVTSELDPSHLLSIVECRVVAVVHRSAVTEEGLVNTIQAAARGGGALPSNLLGELLRQVQSLQQDVLAPRGLNAAGLTPREIDVVRLLADGWDSEEIGNELCYSERTVKNIIHTMTNRLQVRNRPQLVAYGMRCGII